MPGEPSLHPDTRFRDRAELLDFLLEVAEATSSTLDLDAMAGNLARQIQAVVPWDLFALLLYTEREHGLKVRYAVGHRTEVVRRLVIPLGEGITGAAATAREPVLVGEVRDDPRYILTVDAVRSELAVPMIARNRLVGVIDLQSTRREAYTREDAALLRLVATRVAASIDNAGLHRQLVRQNHTWRTLAGIAQSFSATLDLDALLGKIAKAVRKLINYDAFSVLLVDVNQRLLRRRFSLRFDEVVALDSIPFGRGITGAAVEERQPVLVADTRGDPRYIEATPGIRSEVAVPLLVPDRVLGVMDLESTRIGYFTEEHVRTLSLLAPLVANSLENARLYEELGERERLLAEDLGAARDLQEALLLRPAPEIEGLDVAARCRPAREISGDLYDFFEHSAGMDIIAFGDVSGKGAAAALYGALAAGLLRTLAPRRTTPGALLRSLNGALGERKVHATYITLLVLFWRAGARLFTMANAGAMPPLICRRGRILNERVEGVPLGLLDDRVYDELTLHAEPGDAILLYSDGVHDQIGPSGEEYGRRPLHRLLQRLWDRPADEIAGEVLADLDRFRGGAGITDDQTVIALKVK